MVSLLLQCLSITYHALTLSHVSQDAILMKSGWTGKGRVVKYMSLFFLLDIPF